MSAHHHPGKRSEWVSCLEPPELPGDYEYRPIAGKRVSKIHWDLLYWSWTHKGKKCATLADFAPHGQWRGLAEEPK